jgi:hypothetical protein
MSSEIKYKVWILYLKKSFIIDNITRPPYGFVCFLLLNSQSGEYHKVEKLLLLFGTTIAAMYGQLIHGNTVC